MPCVATASANECPVPTPGHGKNLCARGGASRRASRRSDRRESGQGYLMDLLDRQLMEK
jgi:hypothetical protein